MSEKSQFLPRDLLYLILLWCVLTFSNNVREDEQQFTGGKQDYSGAVQAAQLQPAKLTPGLVDWISEQCEQMSQEMEAIIRLEADQSTMRFSLVNYLRYLELYDQLGAIAKRDDIDKLRWVSRKFRAYTRAYESANNLLLNYLLFLDEGLSKMEAKEKKSQQVGVSQAWVSFYETLQYIATHVSIVW